MTQTLRFLQMLFGTEMSGLIEVRLIEERTKEMVAAKRKARVIGIHWYPSPDALMAQFEFLLDRAKGTRSAVFFGVLRRAERGKGTAKDVMPGHVVWADFDDKDFSEGRAGVLAAIARLCLQPSIVVATAHGLHCYWLLREAVAPAVLAAAAKRLAHALGADHTFDAARILRLPGSFNIKDPTNPVEVTIEKFEPDLRYSLAELTSALDSLGAPISDAPESQPAIPGLFEAEQGDAARAAGVEIGDSLSGPVSYLVQNDSRVGALFLGKGKTERAGGGKALDTSSSGYDFSLALSLIRHGVTSPGELATALWHRPDGEARRKGRDYIERTVRRALEFMRGDTEGAGATAGNFDVEHVRVYESVPPQYEFVVGGVPMKLTFKDLRTAAAFESACLASLNRFLGVPHSRRRWEELVNGWLASAERIAMPPEASEDGALREAVERAIEGFSTGEDVEDLDRGLALRLEDGRLAFKTAAVLTAIQAEPLDAQRGAVCRVLKELGYVSITGKFPTKAVRVWVRLEHPEARAREES